MAKIVTKWLNFSQSNKEDNDTIVNEYIAAVVGPTPLRANQTCPEVAACFTVLEANWPFVKWIKAERCNPTQIHEQLIPTQSNAADDQEVESSSIQCGLQMRRNSLYPWIWDACCTMYISQPVQYRIWWSCVRFHSVPSNPPWLDWIKCSGLIQTRSLETSIKLERQERLVSHFFSCSAIELMLIFVRVGGADSTAANCILKWGAKFLSKWWCQNHSGRCEAPPRMFS